MRVKFVVQSALIGCLALLLGLGKGRTQNTGRRPAARRPADRPQRPATPASGGGAGKSWMDERFRRLDRNGDGVLTVDEMTEDLKLERDKWDVNGDCLIDLYEWRAYVTAVLAHQRRTAGDTPKGTDQKPGSKPRARRPIRKPVAKGMARPPFRGQRDRGALYQPQVLPNNLPAWFKEYDTDGDGQVSLYEWKEREDNDREFSRYDLNGDGFITLEELIRSGQFVTDKGTIPPVTGNIFQAPPGVFFYTEVTGTLNDGVWGTDVYSFRSSLSTAAVHAGALRPGERGLVKVTILPGQSQYRGSTRNGVTSRDFGAFHKSYRVQRAP